MAISPSRLQKILAVLALLVFALSIVEIRLQEIVLNYYKDLSFSHTGGQWVPERLQPQPSGAHRIIMPAIPEDLTKPVGTVTIVAAGLGIATTTIWLLGFFAQSDECSNRRRSSAEKSENHRSWSIFICILAETSILYTLAILMYTLIMTYTSSTFHYTEAMSAPYDVVYGEKPSQGRYTYQSWACQMHDFYGNKDDNFWGDGCSKAMAAQWVLIPLLVAMLAFGVVAAMDCKAAIQKSHEKTGSAEEQEELASYHKVSGA